jgi:hypothetical protein
MFKVGDRVKRLQNIGGVLPSGAEGTVVSVNGRCTVQWDMFSGKGPSGPYDDGEISLIHTWQVGDEFEVTLRISGLTERGKLVSTPANGGKYEGRTHFGSVWSFDASGADSFEAIARPILATHTYKPGDKIVATKEHGSEINIPHVAAKVGDVGEYVSFSYYHYVRFNGATYEVPPEYIAPYSTPADSPPLSCIRCGEFYPMAEPNLPGGGLACWSCRKYHAYALTTK